MKRKQKVETNINDRLMEIFTALTSGKYDNFALMSCFINDEPGAAICVMHDAEDIQNIGDPEKKIVVDALFVSITPGMILTDHDGMLAKPVFHLNGNRPKKERGN